ncbi:hypothetical protein HISP_08095 [Haloarcula hispanica N601]|uniref:Uncharacterized protein n=3 Tax=Haloarcula hispanica TaxID=51589 RepID=V5TLJ7_HALHI|nr:MULTISPECIES: hypothetical protein [Haloarcula]AEM57193.1 conserved hypothetical protein [Haloarcula hispanica ATCC 33960]AHB65978.1 hypothetical protein HISP_08095 [Haloarcula hispanica N601]AJF27117.1 hypothetical protein SG26_15915 [Haloarcula sp. CBA1115]KAA9407087.1 hypothetical protein Har1131_09830 [Haloarcula sp. CBA1131]KAA9409879.1 hypothetical protein EGO51_08700 [Haloarcula hispanica]
MSRSRRTFLTTLAAASVTLPLAGCAGGDERSGDEGTDTMNDGATGSMEDEGMTDSMTGGEASGSMEQVNETESMGPGAMTESMTESTAGESMGDDVTNDTMAENETAS